MKQLVGIIILALIALGVWAVVATVGGGEEAEYRQVAKAWIEEESPTFTGRNGSNLEFESSEEVDEDAYRFNYSFEASEAGYGEPMDGEAAAQVITRHDIAVTVSGGEVVQAITDGTYDELSGNTDAENGDDDPATDEAEEVSLYFYDEAEDTDTEGNVLCTADAVLAVSRTIEDYTIDRHIEALLDGPTEEEVAGGLTSEYPLEGFALESSDLSEDGVLTLTFEDPENASSGGSCRATLLMVQVEKTAQSIDGVEEVVIEPAELFQP